MKLKEVRLQRKMEQQELAVSADVSVPMMSYFENYKCLPIPATLKKITTKLNCNIEDIYEDKEIYYKKTAPKKSRKRNAYNLSVRLPEVMRKVITQENLEKLGYHSLKDFIWHCCKSFEEKLNEINKKTATKSKLEADDENVVTHPYITISLHYSQQKINTKQGEK